MAGLDLTPSGMGDEVLALIRPHFSAVRVPSTHDKVYKDECMFSFDSPFSPEGLYVSLSDWQGYGHNYLGLAQERTGSALFLRQRWRRVPVVDPVQEGGSEEGMDASAEEAKPTILAIGVEGGFATDGQKFEVVKEHALVVLRAPRSGNSSGSGVVLEYPNQELPTLVCQAADAVIAHQGAAEQAEVSQWVADNDAPVSAHANDLPWLKSGKKISNDPSTWRCEDSGMDENLWLNLSTGYIGSGRQNWDGSGGTGAALRHYEETGRRYPLAVKLGTITPHGADVYSYAPEQEGMVKDPRLAEHLERWGIDIMSLEKTDKTMAELEVELNKTYDFNKITEAGAQLRPLWGKGYTGLKNLGNSCYMNSCLQLLCALPEVGKRYGQDPVGVFKTAPPDVAGDFSTQMTKVTAGLLSGKYSCEPQASLKGGNDKGGMSMTTGSGAGAGAEGDDCAPAPRMFKHLVGLGHPEFSSGRQQDASEYMQHLLEYMHREERTSGARLGGGEQAEATPNLFQFQMVDRFQCLTSNTVKYAHSPRENLLTLQIPMEEASNKGEVEAYKERVAKRQKSLMNEPRRALTEKEEEEEVKPVVPMSACISRLMATETLPDYFSTATGASGPATKQSRMGNFPRYLLVQLRRYYTDDTWQPKKLDVEVTVPEQLDLEAFRSTGMQADEMAMPEELPAPVASGGGGGNASSAGAPSSPGAATAVVVPDEALVSQLMDMGFVENGCKRAAVAVQNASVEIAMNWVLEHMGDSDFDAPLPPPVVMGGGSRGGGGGGGGGGAGDDINPEAVQMLTSLGFTEEQVKAALRSTGGNPERGADWLFSHTDDLDAAVAQVNSQGADDTAASAAGVGGSRRGGGGRGADSALEDGAGRYSLVGFISHVGKNTGCGHYVAHIKKERRWVIFNDQKVAESAHPPLSLGYLYLFRRDDGPNIA